jgi:tetratricopeptide (TPR) repeat protein
MKSPLLRLAARLSRSVLWMDLFLVMAPAAASQDENRDTSQDVRACTELSRMVLVRTANGQLVEAEALLSAVLAKPVNQPEQACVDVALQGLAGVMYLTGRLSEAAVLAERSLHSLEKSYTRTDPALLRPLQILAMVRFGQGHVAKARELFRRMQLIRTETPSDRAMVHGMAAQLLHVEGRLAEAELEYLGALKAWQEAGRGDTADAASALNFIGALYVEQGRLSEAERTLDHAMAIFAVAKDTAPVDRIWLLNTRAVLHARLGKWGEAEEDLRRAVYIADTEARSCDPAALRSVIANYAAALRKNRKRKEARAIDARADRIRNSSNSRAVIDVAELQSNVATH